MLNWLKSLWGGYSDVIDETTGLSERDVYQVKQTWATVYKNKLRIGMEVFIRLFTEYPITKTFFPSFESLSTEELRVAALFKAHVINFMSGFNMVVTEMEHVDVAIAVCNKIGNSHAPRFIKEEHFHAARIIMLNLLKEELKVSEASLTSWKRFLNFMYQHIFSQLNK